MSQELNPLKRPLPITDFRRVFAHFLEVLFVFDQFGMQALLGKCGNVAETAAVLPT